MSYSMNLLPAARPVPLSLHGNVMSAIPRRSLKHPPVPPALTRRQLTKTVTIAQIVKRLGLTTLGVTKWGDGSQRREPLHFIRTKQGRATRVLIREDNLQRWLEVHRPDLLEVWLSQ